MNSRCAAKAQSFQLPIIALIKPFFSYDLFCCPKIVKHILILGDGGSRQSLALSRQSLVLTRQSLVLSRFSHGPVTVRSRSNHVHSFVFSFGSKDFRSYSTKSAQCMNLRHAWYKHKLFLLKAWVFPRKLSKRSNKVLKWLNITHSIQNIEMY